MIARPAVEYTSLRDIIAEHPTPPPILSPANNSSWNEIPIKNPLVKQAALAYLQATPTPPDVGNKGCFSPSFDWLNRVVFKAIADFFVRLCQIRRGINDREDEEEEILD